MTPQPPQPFVAHDTAMPDQIVEYVTRTRKDGTVVTTVRVRNVPNKPVADNPNRAKERRAKPTATNLGALPVIRCKHLGEAKTDANGEQQYAKCACASAALYPIYTCLHPEHEFDRKKRSGEIVHELGRALPTVPFDTRGRQDLGRFNPCHFCNLREEPDHEP